MDSLLCAICNARVSVREDDGMIEIKAIMLQNSHILTVGNKLLVITEPKCKLHLF